MDKLHWYPSGQPLLLNQPNRERKAGMNKRFWTYAGLLLSAFSLAACTGLGPSSSPYSVPALTGAEQEAVDQLELEVAGNFYYQQLASDQEREDYRYVVHCIQERTEPTKLKTPGDQSAIYMAVAYDFPEYYWLLESPHDYFAAFDYPADADAVMAELHQRADAVIAQLPKGSDYDKVKYLYEYIIHQTDYNTPALTDLSLARENQSIRSVFIDQLSVCNGYSLTFQFLCKKAGLESIFVVGDINQSEIPHAWNLVKIDGQFYTIDTTWGDPVFSQAVSGQASSTIDYSYLCMPPELFNQSHMAWKGFFSRHAHQITYPEVKDASLGYYQLNGGYFETYDQATIAHYIASHLATPGTATISIQLATKADYETLSTDLSKEDAFLHHYLQHLPNYQGFQYTTHPSSQVITVELMTAI